MRIKCFVLLAAIGWGTAWAGVTVSCANDDQSLVFQEGIDNFYLDLVERSSYGTFVGEMRHGGAGNSYGVHVRLPKKTKLAGESAPVCRFSEATGLVFQCVSPVFEGEAELIEVASAKRTPVVAKKLDLSARQVQIQSFDPDSGKMETKNWLRIRYETDAIAEGVKPLPTKPYRVEVDYPLKDCKSGEGIDTPAVY